MKKIPLTQGKFAIVDDDKYQYLMQWRWHTHRKGNLFYVCRKENEELIYMHRQILNAKRGESVDHRNHNGLDNRLVNIRLCTHQQNCQNQRKVKFGTSQYKGVSWNKAERKWRAVVRSKGELIHIGYYDSEIDAAKAYDEKALELFGEFANCNFMTLKRKQS